MKLGDTVEYIGKTEDWKHRVGKRGTVLAMSDDKLPNDTCEVKLEGEDHSVFAYRSSLKVVPPYIDRTDIWQVSGGLVFKLQEAEAGSPTAFENEYSFSIMCSGHEDLTAEQREAKRCNMAKEIADRLNQGDLYKQALFHLRCVAGSRNSFTMPVIDRLLADPQLSEWRTPVVHAMHQKAVEFLREHDK